MENKKVLYAVNGDNQLLVKSSPAAKPCVIRGEFKIDKNNSLIYLVNKKDSWRRIYDLADKVEFKGKWRLSYNYDLVLNLEEKDSFRKNKQLVLKAQAFDCKQNLLIFRIKSRQTGDLSKINLLKFSGNWKTDKFNRIQFEVSKKERPDIITFKNAWDVNRNSQIILTLEKLKTKFKNTLLFKGFWSINSRNRLSYHLNFPSENGIFRSSCFDFRANLESPSLYPAKGIIKYRLGVGLKKARCQRIVTLYGVWKFSRKLGLSFQVDYARRTRTIKFAANLNLSQKNKLILDVKGENNLPLGISLTFTRSLMPRKDFEYFMRLKKNVKLASIDIGGRVNF